MRSYRRFWGFRCPPSIITGIFLAPGCLGKSEGNKSVLKRLHFSAWILVCINEDVRDMESRPKQMCVATGKSWKKSEFNSLSEGTVKTHVKRLPEKLDVAGLTAAIREAATEAW